MRGHRYVFNRLYRFDPADSDVPESVRRSFPWVATCDHPNCTKWRPAFPSRLGAHRAARRHRCPFIVTIA